MVRPGAWACPCCRDRGAWLIRWHSDLSYGGITGTRLACGACGEREWSNRLPERFTAKWGHEWAVVAWMAAAEFEGWRALDTEVGDSREGGWSPDPATWREWIDSYLYEGGHIVWPAGD